MQSPLHRRLRLAFAALAFWTAVGLVFALPRLNGSDATGGWRVALVTSLVE